MHTLAQKPKATQGADAKPAIPSLAQFGQSPEVNSILHVQRAIGNQAVQRLPQVKTEDVEVGSGTTAITRLAHDFSRIPVYSGTMRSIQPKLTSNAPGDQHEQEADRVADQVMRNPGDDGAAPAEVRASVLQRPGVPIEPGAASTLTHRFGFDLSVIRIHADPAAASSARTLGARAYTWGHHVVFGHGAYQPHTARGLALLAHELTHVGQQLGGSTAPEEAQERQADAVEAGGSFAFAIRGGPRPALRLRRGAAVELTIAVGTGGTASFSAVVEGGGAVTGSGSVTELQPGEYRVRSLGAVMIITGSDGSVIPSTTRFDLPDTASNAALNRALSRATASSIPMHVQSGPAPSAAGGGPTGTPTPEEQNRQELQALPEHIRNFLFSPSGGSPARPEDYAALLRIARRIADLSDAELSEYRARTTGGTSDVAGFEASVNRWLDELQAHHSAEREQDEATQALFGLDEIYEMYRSWQRDLLMGDPPSWIAEWEALPVSALPADQEGTQNQLYLRMRRSLAAYGYPNLAAFSTAIQRFLNAFRENAYYIGLDLLDRYEHLLVQERDHYQGGGSAASLYTSLAPARATFQEADEYAAGAAQQFGSWWPEDVLNYHAAGPEYQRRLAQGRAQVASQAGSHPLLANQDFPLEDLGRADEPGVSRVLQSYISSAFEHVRDTRARLRADHEIIFNLDVLVTETKARQGIGPGSIWTKIIEDHQAPTVEEVALEMMIALLAVAAGVMSGGSALVAGASLGLSSYFALQQYEDYAFRADAYGAQLLQEEPSLTWVVLAVIGVAADFAVVSRVLRPIRPALQEFQRTGDIAALEAQLSGVEERIRRSILSRAELELQARRGWESVVPTGALRASVGIDLIADALGKFIYAVQLNLRRGINTFNRWVLTREAIDLIGDINRLSPEQLQRAGALYRQAVADWQRIAAHGRSLGMTAEEVEAGLQSWARRGSGTADDFMREMTASRERQREVLEEFAEAQERYGGAQRDVPTERETGAANLDEPGRIPELDPGYDPYWAPEGGHRFPARNRGEWVEGGPGDGRWQPHDPGAYGLERGQSVPFREGVPDFRDFTHQTPSGRPGTFEVEGLTGNGRQDYAAAVRQLADQEGMTPGQIQAWLSENRLRLHHFSGNEMQIVPERLHGALGHQGSAVELR